MQPYQRRKHELSIEDGCVLWGNRIIIPPPGRAKVIDTLHEGHPGMARMKCLARCYVWWPSMEQELEKKVKECLQCQMMQNSPPQIPTHPWEWPCWVPYAYFVPYAYGTVQITHNLNKPRV